MPEKVGQNDRTVTPAIYPINQLRELLIHPTGLLPDGYFLATPMRNFLVPQATHWPVTAGQPFFRTSSWIDSLSLFHRLYGGVGVSSKGFANTATARAAAKYSSQEQN